MFSSRSPVLLVKMPHPIIATAAGFSDLASQNRLRFSISSLAAAEIVKLTGSMSGSRIAVSRVVIEQRPMPHGCGRELPYAGKVRWPGDDHAAEIELVNAVSPARIG